MIAIGIVGSQSFNDFRLMECFVIENLLPFHLIDVNLIVSGGAEGADTIAQKFARKYEIDMYICHPKWKKYPGKSAAYYRNKDIVQRSQIVFAFWDGQSPGTKMTIDLCTESHVKCHVCNFEGVENGSSSKSITNRTPC